MTLAFVRGHLVPYDNLQRRSGSGWGTLIEAWAGQKSVRRKDEDGGGGDFHGKLRSNRTHASSTDSEARLYEVGGAGSQAELSGPRGTCQTQAFANRASAFATV
jgi:hypothetical protein